MGSAFLKLIILTMKLFDINLSDNCYIIYINNNSITLFNYIQNNLYSLSILTGLIFLLWFLKYYINNTIISIPNLQYIFSNISQHIISLQPNVILEHIFQNENPNQDIQPIQPIQDIEVVQTIQDIKVVQNVIEHEGITLENYTNQLYEIAATTQNTQNTHSTFKQILKSKIKTFKKLFKSQQHQNQNQTGGEINDGFDFINFDNNELLNENSYQFTIILNIVITKINYINNLLILNDNIPNYKLKYLKYKYKYQHS
jgi:hypothetical protein